MNIQDAPINDPLIIGLFIFVEKSEWEIVINVSLATDHHETDFLCLMLQLCAAILLSKLFLLNLKYFADFEYKSEVLHIGVKTQQHKLSVC